MKLWLIAFIKLSLKEYLWITNFIQKKYLDYTIKYLNDEEIKVGDIFNAGETKTAKVKVEYLKNINSEDLPTSDEDIKYSFNIIMVEK